MDTETQSTEAQKEEKQGTGQCKNQIDCCKLVKSPGYEHICVTAGDGGNDEAGNAPDVSREGDKLYVGQCGDEGVPTGGARDACAGTAAGADKYGQ